MDTLQAYFQQAGFDKQDTDLITSRFKEKWLAKGDHFVQEGKKALHMAFLDTGMMQYYSITEQGEERTTYISLPNSFVASLLPYLTETPARESIRALTATTLWVISKKDVVALQNQIPGVKNF